MLKTAAYARVSTENEDQINSLTNQREYFEGLIKANDKWIFGGIFYDEGVTGTQTKKRVGFNRMIDECMKGNIDLILTKEVSRFARNTVDTLEYTRMLREYGVGVIFINDNIDTRDNDGEFRLSIMASAAQEESRKTSERVKWGQRRSMEKGVVFGNNSIFGFDIKNGTLTVNKSEAEIVRRIFHKYADDGKGAYTIARELCKEGIMPPKASNGIWSSAAILRILKNEKYAGDLLQKKYITNDYLTHKKVINTGDDKIFIPNHHEAVIDRDTWDRTQAEIRRRSVGLGEKKKYSNRYWCSGKIICAACGSRFVMRRGKRTGEDYAAWECRLRAEHGRRKNEDTEKVSGCNMRMINNKSLTECMSLVVKEINPGFEAAADEIADEIGSMTKNGGNYDYTAKKLIEETENKKLHMLDSFFAGKITLEEMTKMKENYDGQLIKLKSRLAEEEKNFRRITEANAASGFNGTVSEYIYSEGVYGEIIDKIIVYDEFILVKPKHIDTMFKIRYSTHGYKENYTTVIEELKALPADDERIPD